ncbi:DUF3834 domain-containing protein [Vulcanisaeta thermophila]|uniref:DUF3834 domain-containing protein n=1 Tax=Vulcanisaeta thermophila TaxID=867917 RepID=UPI000853188D|nr:DUF3834 domain-containing protein [Vulcanisaeta thermophila]
MKFLAVNGVVSLPLLATQDSGLDIVYGSYELLGNDFVGLNGNLVHVLQQAPRINARVRWLLGRNYVWVWEREPWIRNNARVGTLYLGSTPDIMIRAFSTALGLDLKVINYEDFKELINDYESGRVGAIVLPLSYLHRVNDPPSYPIDKLFTDYLGQLIISPYAIAARDEASSTIRALYESGIKGMTNPSIRRVIQEKLVKLGLDLPQYTLNFILSNVKFSLIDTVQESLMNLVGRIYGGRLSELIGSRAPID